MAVIQLLSFGALVSSALLTPLPSVPPNPLSRSALPAPAHSEYNSYNFYIYNLTNYKMVINRNTNEPNYLAIEPDHMTIHPNQSGVMTNSCGIKCANSVGYMTLSARVLTPHGTENWKFGVFLSDGDRTLLKPSIASKAMGASCLSLGWHTGQLYNPYGKNIKIHRELFSTPIPAGWTWEMSFNDLLDEPDGNGYCGYTSITFINPFNE